MPLIRRRPVLRAAAVGGGAYALGKRRARAEQEDANPPVQQSAPGPQAPAPGVSSADTARLEELGRLHEQGVLTDEEFAQQKALILGGR